MKKHKEIFTKRNIAYFLIAVSFVLLMVNLSDFNFDDLSQNKYSGIASNLLLILATILTIINKNRTEKK